MSRFNFSFLNKIRSHFSRYFLYILGIGAVSFVFEACYGSPQASELNKNFKLKGKLLTEDGKAASNVDLIATSSTDVENAVTLPDGSFSMDINARFLETVNIKVVNGNGETFVLLPDNKYEINLNVNNNE